jgi:hypothetical protein
VFLILWLEPTKLLKEQLIMTNEELEAAIAGWQAVRDNASLNIEKNEAELAEALRELLGWHDDADNLHKPIEVRAAYIRARALLARIDGDEA